MAIDARIPLGVDNFSAPNMLMDVARVQGARKQNELADLAISNAKANEPVNAATRETEIDMQRLKSTVLGAERLRTFVEAGDLPGALADLQSRKATLDARGTDSTDTDRAIAAVTEALNTGDLTKVKAGLDQAREVGTRYGVLKSDSQLTNDQGKPSALVEQYALYAAQARQAGQKPLPFVDPEGKGKDFITQFSQSQVGAQYGAPVDHPGIGVVQPSRLDPSKNVTLAPETAVATAEAGRAAGDATARAEVAATAEQKKELVANQRTLEVWNVAKQGLVNALSGTSTGPLEGRIPAVTAGQQIAEGAVASVSPVLKQLFRSAGEGVFTDRDQQLLLDMVPTRTDHPETAAAKIGMIDAIIQAKLAASVPGNQAAPTDQPVAQGSWTIRQVD
jgi:hypothetical protein